GDMARIISGLRSRGFVCALRSTSMRISASDRGVGMPLTIDPKRMTRRMAGTRSAARRAMARSSASRASRSRYVAPAEFEDLVRIANGAFRFAASVILPRVPRRQAVRIARRQVVLVQSNGRFGDRFLNLNLRQRVKQRGNRVSPGITAEGVNQRLDSLFGSLLRRKRGPLVVAVFQRIS